MCIYRTRAIGTIASLIAMSLLITRTAAAQPDTGGAEHPLRPLVALSAGFYFGGFPLLLETGARGGIGLFRERLIVGADYGLLVGPISVRDVALRAQLGPIPSEGVLGRLYLHGYRRWIGKGAGYGGGIGYRMPLGESPAAHMFVELSVATTRSIVDGEGDFHLVPSLLRMGLATSIPVIR